MTPLGGFFELEIPGHGRGHYHPMSQGVPSGRAGFGVILDAVKPETVHVPFYACDSLLAPLRERGIPARFYGLDDRLEPAVELAPAPGELAVYVDYFGLKGPFAAGLHRRLESRLVLDLVQAFFARPPAGARAFNSARKWFGVPDGGYVLGAEPPLDAPRNDGVRFEHLVNRLLGHQERAFREFREAEAAVEHRPWRMSLLSERLLSAVDYAAVARARRQNFAALARQLASENALSLEMPDDVVPFCYPFLPSRAIDRARLHARGIFVPTFWPDVLARARAGFELERRLARDLLPLPVDHRLTPDDCDAIVEVLRQP